MQADIMHHMGRNTKLEASKQAEKIAKKAMQ